MAGRIILPAPSSLEETTAHARRIRRLRISTCTFGWKWPESSGRISPGLAIWRRPVPPTSNSATTVPQLLASIAGSCLPVLHPQSTARVRTENVTATRWSRLAPPDSAATAGVSALDHIAVGAGPAPSLEALGPPLAAVREATDWTAHTRW